MNSDYTNFGVFEADSNVESIQYINHLWIAYYFKDFVLDEWEVHLYSIIPSLR